MWSPGDVVAWRGIYRERIWHAIPTFVVKDTQDEFVSAIVPGAECMMEEHYARRGKNGKRRWDFAHEDWRLEKFIWHTNHVISLLEPDTYYSVMLFWHHERHEFLGYYVNFQQPFVRSHCGIESIDLDLDLDVAPDLSFVWKDEDDYQKAVEHGLLPPEWIYGVENAREDILNRLEKRQYPFDGSWLDWKPDPAWMPPTLPEGWDRI